MQTVVSLWRKQVEATPNQQAVVYKDNRYTYQEADLISERLAARIKTLVLGDCKDEKLVKDQVVAVLIGRNQWIGLAPLGVAKAGCAYQPLDPAYPQERLRYMIADAKASVLIADEELLPLLGDITMPVILTKDIEQLPTVAKPLADPDPTGLLMLIYTSGTTGQPKGVMQEQRNIASACVAFGKYLGMKVGSRVANYASFGFVPTVVESWGAFSLGATLHILDNAERFDVERLRDYIHRESITHLFMTTMMAYQFAASMDDDTTLQVLSCGGEKLPPLTPPKHIRIVNFYGSSECTSVTGHDITEREEQPVMGKPLGDTKLAVITPSGQPAAPGQEGELWVMGPQVSRGYLNAPELTAQKFDENHEGRIFKTGDIVIRREDGELQFVGRRDGMVKVRGFRVELKEIESILLEYPGVKNATVKDFDNPSGGKFLTGYVVSDQPVDGEDIKRFVASKKPDYMVPEFIMQLEKIPVNQNQKVDKRALPHPHEQLAQGTAPQNALQKELFDIVADIIKTTSFGIETPLQLAGLTSITAIKLASQLLKKFGVDADAKTIVKQATILSLEEMINGQRATGDNQRTTGNGQQAMTDGPLSYSQTGIYVECVMNPESVAYNIPVYMPMAKGVTIEELRQALQEVIDLHPMLKTHFETRGEEIVQVTDANQPLNVTEVTIADSELTTYTDHFVRPFDLQHGPLYRAEIVTTGEGITLFLDIHHLVSDGTSFDIFFRQLCKRLDGQNIEPEMLSYLQFAQEQKEADKGEAKEFFRQLMAHYEAATEIPTDHNNPKTGQECCYVQPLDWERIEAFCRAQGITPCHLLLAATIYTASRYSNTRDVSLCTISSGRADLRISDTIGMFVNTLPICEEIGEGSVSDFLHQVSEHFDQSLRHEQYPFADIASDYGFHPQLSFVYQVGLFSHYEVRGEQLSFTKIDSHMPKFKLQVMVFEDGAHVNYDDACYELPTIKGFGSSLAAVVEHFIEQPERSIRQISIISGEQQVQLSELRSVKTDDDTKAPFKLFHECIGHYAKIQPDHDALIANDAQYTYKEMDEATNRIANALRQKGVQERDRVALLLPRTSRLILSMFGVLKSGAAYIPCDPEYPADRVKLILEDSEARYIITTKDRMDTVPADKAIDVEALLASPVSCDTIAANITGDDLAYLIYTSGSTGRPKGVMLRHEGICNFLTSHPANVEAYAVSHTAKTVLAVTTISFDASMHEIGISLYNGLTLVLANEEQSKNPLMMADIINKHHIGYVSATPSQWQTWIYSTDFVEAIRQVPIIRFGGEKLPEALLHQMQQLTPSRIINTYGPTETTVSCNTSELTHAKMVTVGRPLFNVTEFVVDCDGNELPVGVVGELYIGGRGVGRGYHNLEEMTNLRFINYLGRRIYRSGDYAKWLANGEVVILGRTDHQIKLRGLRIELGEVEHAIASYPGVQQVVVMVRKVAGTEHLCAYFTASEVVDTTDMKQAISANLTEYMVPTVYMQLEKMPITPNGKIDQKALPEPEVTQDEVMEEQQVPMNKLETALHELAAEIMQNEHFGLMTPLQQAGLTSLSAIRLAVAIQQRYGVMLQSKQLIKGATLQTVEDEIVSQLLVLREESKEGATSSTTQTATANRDSAPLTSAQKGVYMECMKEPTGMAYNTPFKMAIPSSVTAEQLKTALTAIIKAHPQFNVHFEIRSSAIMQVMDSSLEPQITILSMTDEELTEYCQQFMRPFNLNKGPLYRFEIVNTPQALYLMGDIHHLIFDGSSRDIFNSQLVEALGGKEIPAENYTLLDYATDEQAQDFTEAKRFFDNMLKNCEGASDVPNDVKKGNQPGSLQWVRQNTDLKAAEDFCKQNNLTPASLYLSAVLYTIARYTSNKDAYICTISSGRSNLRIARTMGMFVNTLPLSATIGNESVIDFLRQTAQRLEQTLEYEQYPFAQIAADYGYKPSINFAWQVGIRSEHRVDGVLLKTEPLELKTPKFKLDIAVENNDGTPCVAIGYDDAYYSEAYMESFAESVDTCVKNFMSAPSDAPVRKISIVSDNQQKQLANLRQTAEGETTFKLFHECISHYAKTQPDHQALIACDANFTYKEMDEATNRIANALRQKGVKERDCVAMLLPRTSRLILSLFGILKAGAAYIPCDPEYPADRVKLILEDSEARYIITTKDRMDTVPADKAIDVETLLASSVSCDTIAANITPDDLAYLIYTSGSTGRPKGVMLRHKGICNFLTSHPANVEAYAVSHAAKTVLAITTISFDASMHEIGVSLYNGLTLVLANEEQSKNPIVMAEMINEHHIEYVSATPSQWQTWIYSTAFIEAIRQVPIIRFGGEKLPEELLHQMQKITPSRIINTYGPTETAVSSNISELTDAETVTVGKPLYNVIEFVVDTDGNELPVGVVGELYIGGRGVARGYKNLDDMTRERFIDYRGIRIYKSGDYAKWQPDGHVVILGRTDHQIKLRGLRIELGEIENVMFRVEGIKKVAILIRKINDREHLCAYYTADREIAADDLKGEISKSLTQYMVPTAYLQLKEMPMTPNGKTDVKALPEPELAVAGEYVAPANDTERTFCDIFAGILKLDKVGATDNFFELGGTSLAVMQIVVAAEQKNIRIAYRDVFDKATPRLLAQFITGETVVKNRDEVSDFDYTAIDNLLKRNTVDSFRKGELSKLKHVMVTGATGYLGIHILNELINSDAEHIYCLVRGKSLDVAESRLRTLLYYYFSKSFKEQFGKRLHVVLGDVTNDLCTLLDDIKIDTLFNCAAIVKHFSEGTEIEDVNIGGVQRCIDYCIKANVRLIHVSTASTRGLWVGDPKEDVYTEQRLYMGQFLNNKYVYSKFMSERIVLDAIALHGLDAKIMRVGNLAARSTDGEFQANFSTNSFMGRIRVFNMLGCCPYEMRDMRVEFSPINEVSHAIVLLATTPKECTVFHPYNNHGQFFGDVLFGLSSVGQGVRFVEQEEFAKAMEEAKNDPTKARQLAALLAYQGAAQGQKTTDVQRDNEYTMQVLYRMDFAFSQTSWDYVEQMLTAISGFGFFE